MEAEAMSRSGWVRIVCTDKGTHPSRELAVVVSRGDDPQWRETLLGAEDLTTDEARWVYELEAVSSNAQRAAARGGAVVCSTVESVRDEHAEIDDPAAQSIWRFRCPTCRRDVPLRDENVRRLAEGVLVAADRPRVVVDLSDLPANFE